MPRGKIANVSSSVKAEDINSNTNTNHSDTTASQFQLVSKESANNNAKEETVAKPASNSAYSSEASSLNFKFTLLLVALFVVVNIGLVSLLDSDKNAADKPAKEENSIETASKPQEQKPVLLEKTDVSKPVLITPAATPVSNVVLVAAPAPASALAPSAAPVATPAVDKKEPAPENMAAPVNPEDLYLIINKE
jgi:hypothetical protein